MHYGGFIGGLIVAVILSAFGVQVLITEFCLQVFHFTLTNAMYYVGFGLIGLIGNIVNYVFRKGDSDV